MLINVVGTLFGIDLAPFDFLSPGKDEKLCPVVTYSQPNGILLENPRENQMHIGGLFYDTPKSRPCLGHKVAIFCRNDLPMLFWSTTEVNISSANHTLGAPVERFESGYPFSVFFFSRLEPSQPKKKRVRGRAPVAGGPS